VNGQNSGPESYPFETMNVPMWRLMKTHSVTAAFKAITGIEQLHMQKWFFQQYWNINYKES